MSQIQKPAQVNNLFRFRLLTIVSESEFRGVGKVDRAPVPYSNTNSSNTTLLVLL